MPEKERDFMLLVTSKAELPAAHRVWGTGGWLPPEQREALDWLTLARFLGWGVTVTRWTRSGLDTGLPGGSRLVVLACNPDCLGEELVALLTSRLAAEPILVVTRVGTADGACARLGGATRRSEQIMGRTLRWLGPGPERLWSCRQALDAHALELSADTSIWATLEGAPVIVARRVGRGVVAALSFHPSLARDADGAATALLKHLLIWGTLGPIAWLDLEGSLILRMDDPGGAQNIYSRTWSYPKLGAAQWAAIGTDLKRRNARLSIGYVAGWVDDGEAARGALQVAGHLPDRLPGQVYPSPLVQYRDLAGHTAGTLHDYEAEFRGIQSLRTAGLGDVELHGYTHMHPDSVVWAHALDRYEAWPATSWFRELGRIATATIAARPPDAHPLALGIAVFRQYFDVSPTTLICPGDQWTNDVLERALDLGLHLVSSYYLALRDGDRICWAQHVCAPYLNEPNPTWFDAGLPVVGYFHDREPALEGVDWIARWLDRWQAAGARSLMDFRELAAAVCCRLQLEERDNTLRLTMTSEGAPALVKPLTITIRLPAGRPPARLTVSLDDRDLSLQVQQLGGGLSQVILPPQVADVLQ